MCFLSKWPVTFLLIYPSTACLILAIFFGHEKGPGRKSEQLFWSAILLKVCQYHLCKWIQYNVILPAMEDLHPGRNWLPSIHCAGNKSQRKKNESVGSKISPEKYRDIESRFILFFVWVSITLWNGLICFQYEFRSACPLLGCMGELCILYSNRE